MIKNKHTRNLFIKSLKAICDKSVRRKNHRKAQILRYTE